MMNVKPIPAIAILIIISSVLLLAFAKIDGCKDTAEAMMWSHTDEEPPECVWYYDGETTYKYYPTPRYVNMPWKVYEGMTFYDTREGIESEKRMWCYDGNDFIQFCDIDIPEPNEPEVDLTVDFIDISKTVPNEPEAIEKD